MAIEPVHDLADPRLDPYRELRRTNATRSADWFIAEGKTVVRRLLNSRFPVRSVLLAEKRVAAFGPLIPATVPVLVVTEELCSRLVGFDFHAGVMACAGRQWGGLREIAAWPAAALVVCCPEVMLPDNLGSIARLAAGFGAVGLVTGPRAADPFSRRVVRVSMGNLFRLDVFCPADPAAWLNDLRRNCGFRIVGLEREPNAVDVAEFRRPARMVLVLGNEAHGLGRAWLDLCDAVIGIPMAHGVDSLNVAHAAAIALYGLARHDPAVEPGRSAPSAEV